MTQSILIKARPRKGFKFVRVSYWDGATHARLTRNAVSFNGEDEGGPTIRKGSIGTIVGHGTSLSDGKEDFDIQFGKHIVFMSGNIVTLAQRKS